MPFSVRLAQEQELAGLAAIEVEARSRFSDEKMPAPLRAYETPAEELLASYHEKLIWIAEDVPNGIVGFLAAEPFEQGLHVLQMSVRPSFGRRGIGTKLLSEVSREARHRGLGHVTLTTFADVPWNAPAYVKSGFIPLEAHQLSAALRERLANENAAGLRNRVAMLKSAK